MNRQVFVSFSLVLLLVIVIVIATISGRFAKGAITSTITSMSRSLWRNLLVVTVFWAAIYLPGLGTLEIKGEEGRRILPAVTMLETGNFLVPQVGSEPYFRKPPLINWLVAGSFKIFGRRDEWTARIPSALCILAVALAFVTVARASLGPIGSLIGALVWLTNFGMMEKGRLIEIEALYVSLGGLATICWLSWWEQKRSPWLTWIVPWIILGLGLLAKGPVLLVFFYAVVFAVVWRETNLRPEGPPPGRSLLAALSPQQHSLGILLMLGIFAAWAVPCLRLMHDRNVGHIWTQQFSGRLSGEDFKLAGWLLNIPRGLGYFLPWIVLLPLVRRARFAHERSRQLAHALFWAIALSFVGISLLPGSLARYTMPLLAPAAWLVAMLLASGKFALPWPKFFAPPLRLPLLVAAVASVVIAIYAWALMPQLRKREKVRNIAAQLNAAIVPNESLYAVDPDYQPSLFYLHVPIIYLDQVQQAPATARYLLVQPDKEEQALASEQWSPAHAQRRLSLKDYRGKEVRLLEIVSAR